MARFATTHWYLVGAAEPEARRDAAGEPPTRYLPALRAHVVRRKGVRPAEADDLLQGFVSQKVLEQEILMRVVPGDGKFRTWLLAALDRYAVSASRQATPARSDVFDQTW